MAVDPDVSRRARGSKRRGRYYERLARRHLERLGYLCTRAAGSLGLFDLIAIGPDDVRAVQVKGGKRPRLKRDERDAIAALPVAPCVRKELWKFYAGETAADVEPL